MARMVLRREAAFLAAALALTAAGGVGYYLSRATVLTIAVAPKGGTEPALIRAFADALAAGQKDVRLTILAFDGVKESARALEAGQVDLAVVRPDVAMPRNGLTLAILRELAVLLVVPESSEVAAPKDLAGKRLGYLSERIADTALIAAVIEQDDLETLSGEGLPAGGRGVRLVPVEERAVATAFAESSLDALMLVTTPSNPAARRLVGLVRAGTGGRGLRLIGLPDHAAIVERQPKLQPVTVVAGMFGGDPRLPAEDLTTLGASYRLMARETLPRGVAASVTQLLFEARARLAQTQPAANFIEAPAYDSTADATSARLPIHPGAIDYFEREQKSFVERYEIWIYLVLFFGGGVLTMLEWLRLRLSRMRRERIEIATDKLLKIRLDARKARDAGALRAMTREIDDLAASIARFAMTKPVEARTIGAASIAIDAARSSVRAGMETLPDPLAGQPEQS